MNLKVIAGSCGRDLATGIAEILKVPVSPCIIKRFKDSETYVKIDEKIRGDDLFIIQPVCAPVNDNFVELLLMIDAAKRASAGRINVVMPYFAYARQDRKSSPRESIAAKVVANCLTVAGANRIISVDLHADQIQGFFDIPVDHFVGYPLFAEYFKKQGTKDFVVVSPDTGFAKKARKFAKLLELPLAIIDKRRPVHNESEVLHVIGDVRGMHAILLDDLIDTGGTITNGVNALKEKGAKDVYICATHGVLSGSAIELLKRSRAVEIILTDTIPSVKKTGLKNLKIISIVPLLARTIRRIHEHRSLGEIYTWEKEA
jgi:ribose-phosphate pyrophosphokinase